MTREFEDDLIGTGRSWVSLDGPVETRVELALDAIDTAIKQAFDFQTAD
jgi:hypothetical protein